MPSISVSLDSVFDNSCQTIYSFVICEEAFLVFYYISKSMNEFTMVGHADLAINITNCTMCCCFVFSVLKPHPVCTMVRVKVLVDNTFSDVSVCEV